MIKNGRIEFACKFNSGSIVSDPTDDRRRTLKTIRTDNNMLSQH